MIIAQDEERTIGSVIDAAAPLVSEIIVVDSGSTDGTIEIARRKGAKVIHQDWLGFADQKNFAMSQASGDWILSLDADEILTPALVDEIRKLSESSDFGTYDGYKLPRVLYIGDTPVRHGGFYPDAQLRLIKRGAGVFGKRMVHEAIKITGPVRTLEHHMDHYGYKSEADFGAAMEKYARLSASEYQARGDKPDLLAENFKPLWTFFYRYLLRGGILDGALGLRLALRYSQYVRDKWRYLRELAS